MFVYISNINSIANETTWRQCECSKCGSTSTQNEMPFTNKNVSARVVSSNLNINQEVQITNLLVLSDSVILMVLHLQLQKGQVKTKALHEEV